MLKGTSVWDRYLGWLLFSVVGLAFTIFVIVTHPGPSAPTDPQSIPNSEYLDSLGMANNVLPGCAFWPGETAGLKMVLYFGTGDDTRITAVCVPK